MCVIWLQADSLSVLADDSVSRSSAPAVDRVCSGHRCSLPVGSKPPPTQRCCPSCWRGPVYPTPPTPHTSIPSQGEWIYMIESDYVFMKPLPLPDAAAQVRHAGIYA